MNIIMYTIINMSVNIKHVHLVLQGDLLDDLDSAAAESNTTRSEIIRAALQAFVRRRAGERKAAEMRAYARSMADSSDELIKESDGAVVEQLLRETDW